MMNKLAKGTADLKCLSKKEMMASNSQFNYLVCIIDKWGKRIEEIQILNKWQN